MLEEANSLKEILVKEWSHFKRHFPWRETREPYRLAVAELMLVRTKPQQVAVIWDAFFARFPDAKALSIAPAEEVQQQLVSLGLKWRARLVHEFARRIIARYGGEVPTESAGLQEVLPLGDYASASVALQVQGLGPLPIDTGVARFLNRYFGLEAGGELRRARTVLEAATATGSWNREEFYALLDLASVICVPRKPRSEKCPLQSRCRYATSVSSKRGDLGA